MNLPNTAYILLWFPKPSETFIFSEVKDLDDFGLPLSVFTLYGKAHKKLSSAMKSYNGRVKRLGIRWFPILPLFFIYWLLRSPVVTSKLFIHVIFRKWRGFEKTVENIWACSCAFYLAYRFEQEKIEHIHAPWASGCASAAWVASSLTGIPFSFTMRAWDIYPPDSLIHEKVTDAVFVRSETQYNIDQIHRIIGCEKEKFHLTYNGVPIISNAGRTIRMKPPYRLLAVGRLVRKKGYEILLYGCRLLKEKSLDFHLDLVGDGILEGRLRRLSKKLNIDSQVTFHGFQPHECIPDFLKRADLFLMPCVISPSGDRDGIPTVLMEALLYQVPVITTPVSGIPELIEHGVTGVLVPPEDPAALADGVCRLVAEKDKAIVMAEKGRKKVMELFDPEKNHMELLTLYSMHGRD